MNEELIGACGLYCGACDNYRAFQKDNEYLLDNAKFSGENRDSEYCEGCNSGHLSEHCAVCKIRLCVQNKKLPNCGLCGDYPCETVREFRAEGEKWNGAKHRRDIFINLEKYIDLGKDKWLENNLAAWKCECGLSYTYYENRCHRCGKKLKSYSDKA